MGEAINYDDYTVAWMCFDELVETTLLLMFDEEHGTVRSSRSKLKDVIQQFIFGRAFVREMLWLATSLTTAVWNTCVEAHWMNPLGESTLKLSRLVSIKTHVASRATLGRKSLSPLTLKASECHHLGMALFRGWCGDSTPSLTSNSRRHGQLQGRRLTGLSCGHSCSLCEADNH